jgi:hypothetical protein
MALTRAPSVLAISLLASAAFVQSWFAGVNRADEVWFLTLAKLVGEGAVPYRDVAFYVLPGSLYLTVGVMALLGSQLLVLKGLLALVSAGAAWLAFLIFRQIGGERTWALPFLLTCLLLAPTVPAAPYGPLAYLFQWAALLAVLTARARQDGRLWLVGGALAGLAFVAKYNVGALTLAAVLVAWTVGERTRRWRVAAGLIAAFLAVVGVSLLPVVLSGTWQEFAFGVWGTKGTYVQKAVTLPLQGKLAGLPPAVLFTPAESILRLALRSLSFLIVGLSLVGVVRSFHGKAAEQSGTEVLALFLLAALAGALPRLDSEHVLPVVPLALVPVFLFLQRRAGPFPPLLWRWLPAGALLLTFALPALAWQQGFWHPSRLPHLSGARLSGKELAAVEATRTFVAALPGEQKILFLGPYAPFYYLVTERRPPTRYILPLLSALGARGQQELVEALETSEIDWVCLQSWNWSLRPVAVESYVERQLIMSNRTGECTWYRNPDQSPETPPPPLKPDQHHSSGPGFDPRSRRTAT